MSWQPLTRETTTATQQAIEDIIGLSRITFRASAFLAQGDGAAFTEAAPRDRKSILAEILGLSIWDRMLEKARGELRDAERELIAASTNAERLEAAVADQPIAIAARDLARRQRDGAAELVVEAEEQLEQAQERLAAVAAKNERVLRLKAELEAASEAYVRIHGRLGDALAASAAISDCRAELEDVEADAAAIPALESKLEDLRAAAATVTEARRRRDELTDQLERREAARQRLVDQALELHAGANDARAKAQHLDDHIGEASTCDRCGQTLGAEAAARAAKSYRDDAVELDRRAGAIDVETSADLEAIAALHEQLETIEIPADPQDPAPVEAQLRDRRAAAEKLGQLRERITNLAQLAAEIPALTIQAAEAGELGAVRGAAFSAALEDAGDLTAAEHTVAVAKSTVRDTRAALEQRAAELARAEQRLEQIAAAQAELDQLSAATADLHARVDVLKLAERAYGRDGIPALILESSAIPTIETEANRIVQELGTGYRIELRTQRENKTGGLREALDIVVYDGSHARPYETFSGGEKTRINLALRLALASLLAHRRGAESRILCIDEPDGLDSAGMDALVEVLRRLAGTFEKTLVVSHQPQLGSSFDQTLRVEKSGDFSRIAGDREAVLA